MATVSVLGTPVWNTNAGNHTVTATPAVNDLIVIVAGYSNTAQLAQTLTDDNASGTYTEIQHAFHINVDRAVGLYVRTALIPAASSTIFTATVSGNTGGGLCVFQISGMSKTGATAIRQSNLQTNGAAAGTPTIGLGVAVLTSNPVIGGVVNASSPAGLTPKASPAYSEGMDLGYATPTSGMETMFISSGETASSIAWGSTSATVFNAVLAELDAAAAAVGSLIYNSGMNPALIVR